MKTSRSSVLPSFPRVATLRGCVLAGLTLLLATTGARAAGVVTQAELPALAQQWLDRAVAKQEQRWQSPLRMRAELGRLDARLKLAACQRVEPYLPAGTRLWGSSRLGLRCLQGPTHWNVFMPVTVTAMGQAWVLRRDVSAGSVLQEEDLMAAEADWAAERSPVLVDKQEWVGHVATRLLATGQILREHMVRAPQVFQAGTQVRVLVQGGGFQIRADGQALTPGVVGQPARVRMSNGRVMSGMVLDARTVRLSI